MISNFLILFKSRYLEAKLKVKISNAFFLISVLNTSLLLYFNLYFIIIL